VIHRAAAATPATKTDSSEGHQRCQRDGDTIGPRLTGSEARGYDGAVSAGAPHTRTTRCLHCGTAIVWTGNPNRPFCSLACRLIDLGGWLDERYRIPGPGLPDESAPDDRPRARG